MLVDKILGFDMKAVEAALVKQGQVVLPQGSYESWGPALHNGSQTWVGLDAQRLNTPYDVLRKMIQLLKPRDNELVVDLGAGMGRLGVVLAMLAPQAQFLGFEYVPERVQMARAIYQRWNCSKALCEVKDLMASDFVLPQAAVYFIYDYGKREHILQTLKQIQRVSCGRPVRLVARGHATWRLVEEYCADFTETFAGDDIENFRIYRC